MGGGVQFEGFWRGGVVNGGEGVLLALPLPPQHYQPPRAEGEVAQPAEQEEVHGDEQGTQGGVGGAGGE